MRLRQQLLRAECDQAVRRQLAVGTGPEIERPGVSRPPAPRRRIRARISRRLARMLEIARTDDVWEIGALLAGTPKTSQEN
ncbi:MAG: hypothetical protein ABR953_02385 [Candidatus Acidiferrales bacterium]